MSRPVGQYSDGPVTHLLWLAFIEKRRPEFLEEIHNKRIHAVHPLCRVTGSRKYICTKDPLMVTCRACLKRMALEARGEGAWRDVIIKCYSRGRIPTGTVPNGPRKRAARPGLFRRIIDRLI